MTLQEYFKDAYPGMSLGKAATAFAKEIDSNRQTVERYMDGTRFPIPMNLAKIKLKTSGLVTADDFVPPIKPKKSARGK